MVKLSEYEIIRACRIDMFDADAVSKAGEAFRKLADSPQARGESMDKLEALWAAHKSYLSSPVEPVVQWARFLAGEPQTKFTPTRHEGLYQAGECLTALPGLIQELERESGEELHHPLYDLVDGWTVLWPLRDSAAVETKAREVMSKALSILRTRHRPTRLWWDIVLVEPGRRWEVLLESLVDYLCWVIRQKEGAAERKAADLFYYVGRVAQAGLLYLAAGEVGGE